MNFAFSEEQEELRRAVRRFLSEKSPETEVRRLMETDEGYDPAVWRQMADQLGLQSLIIPEEYGGSGFSYVELMVVLEEMGAALLCAPYFATVALATNAVLTSGDDSAKKYLLPGLASGETIGTLAITEDNGRWDAEGITLEATATGDGWQLNGHKSYVIDGLVADLVVVAGRTANGVSLFGVKGDAAGLTKTPLTTMDQTRSRHASSFANTPAWLIGTEGGALTRPRQDPGPGRGGTGRRAGGRRPARPGYVGRVREDPDPVRPAHRELPGDQAQVRGHAVGGRVRQVGGLLRGLGGCRGLRRAARGRQPGQVVLLGGVLPCSGREHPDPRRHRVHVGHPRTSTSSGPSPRSSSSAIPPITASCWPSASVSEPGEPRRCPAPAERTGARLVGGPGRTGGEPAGVSSRGCARRPTRPHCLALP